MPYIPAARRVVLNNDGRPETPGELNYVITRLLIDYVDAHGLSYENLNAVVGAVDSAKCEFQRRVVGPYEDRKRDENGDVYPLVMAP